MMKTVNITQHVATPEQVADGWRRWHAVGGICLSAVSQNGINQDKSRISAPVPSVWLEAIEMIPASDTAIDSIEGAAHANA